MSKTFAPSCAALRTIPSLARCACVLLVAAALTGQAPPGAQSPSLQGPLRDAGNHAGGTNGMQAGQGTSGTSPAGAALSSANSNAYDGSIVVQPPTDLPLDLSLAGAIQRGLVWNLGAFLAGSAITRAQAQRVRALSEILPQIAANARQTRQRESLHALGITFPQVPPTVEFSVTDFRATLNESLALSAFDRKRAAEASVEASRLDRGVQVDPRDDQASWRDVDDGDRRGPRRWGWKCQRVWERPLRGRPSQHSTS